MKITIILFVLVIYATTAIAQPCFDLGIKGGANFSKISFNTNDYSSESVTKAHFGAFSRVGWGRIFVQPEAYFSAKGGNVSSNVLSTATSFDYTTFDVPVLLGIKIIKSSAFDFHVVAGPVFSFLTASDVQGDDLLDTGFYENKYVAVQYGLGIDILFLTLDARMEHGVDQFYTQQNTQGKNQNFMLSIGFKFL